MSDVWDRFLALLYSEENRSPSDYTFSFGLGPQPKVLPERTERDGFISIPGVSPARPISPTVDERRDRQWFSLALALKWGRPTGLRNSAIDEDIPAQPDYNDLDTVPVDVREEYEWALDESNFSHPDPTDHGNQGSYISPTVARVLLNLGTKRIGK